MISASPAKRSKRSTVGQSNVTFVETTGKESVAGFAATPIVGTSSKGRYSSSFLGFLSGFFLVFLCLYHFLGIVSYYYIHFVYCWVSSSGAAQNLFSTLTDTLDNPESVKATAAKVVEEFLDIGTSGEATERPGTSTGKDIHKQHSRPAVGMEASILHNEWEKAGLGEVPEGAVCLTASQILAYGQAAVRLERNAAERETRSLQNSE